MNIIIKGASGFMGLFDTGAETFVSWVSGIVPKVLLLLILMNTIIALIGQERVNKFAKLCSGNVILAYGVLPFISAFMLGNPMALSMGKFLPERMQPSYYASAIMHQLLIIAIQTVEFSLILTQVKSLSTLELHRVFRKLDLI